MDNQAQIEKTRAAIKNGDPIEAYKQIIPVLENLPTEDVPADIQELYAEILNLETRLG